MTTNAIKIQSSQTTVGKAYWYVPVSKAIQATCLLPLKALFFSNIRDLSGIVLT